MRKHPWVRIPLPPPLALAKRFSPSGWVRIFSLFSRVMRVGLNTGMGAGRAKTGLSGPIFSGPDDCADLVNSFQATGIAMFFRVLPEHFDPGGARRDGTETERSPCCRGQGSTRPLADI